MLVLAMASTASPNEKTKCLYSTLEESSHTNICFFPSTQSLPNTAAGPPPPGGPPSCWIATWWRKGDGPEVNINLTALLQPPKSIFSCLFTLWIPFTSMFPNYNFSMFLFYTIFKRSSIQSFRTFKCSMFEHVSNFQFSNI